MHHPLTKIAVFTFLPPIVAMLIILVCSGGCAKIPNDGMPDPPIEPAVLCTVAVRVSGGGLADIDVGINSSVLISPAREVVIQPGDSVRIGVDVGGAVNARVAAISANGEELCRFGAEGAVVTDTGVELRGVRVNTEVLVELARIDTIAPEVEIVWPAAVPSGAAASLPDCTVGRVCYRLNKGMASGTIAWREVTDPGFDDFDSLRVVRVPGDITNAAHSFGGLAYVGGAGYLGEGVQKFDFAVSPKVGKRVAPGGFAANRVYVIEAQFVDSLGNRSRAASRTVGAASAVEGACAAAEGEWLGIK